LKPLLQQRKRKGKSILSPKEKDDKKKEKKLTRTSEA
jgi:hypothetical protein